MPLNKNFFLVLFLIASSSTIAQNVLNEIDQDSATTWKLLKYDVNTTWQGVKYSFTKPLTWKGKDYVKLGGLLVGTLALSAADEEFERFASRNRSGFPEPIRDFGWYFGSPQNYFLANASLYGFGLLTKNKKIRHTSVLIITSSITTGVIQSLSKTAFGRARPSAGLGAHSFDMFSSEGKFHSFPSGHTILSVTMAHSIAKQFDNLWVKSGIYIIGAIPPVSRIVDGQHWLTDIAFSAALSIIVVDGVDKFLKNNNAHDVRTSNSKKISWNLSFSPNQFGLTGTF